MTTDGQRLHYGYMKTIYKENIDAVVEVVDTILNGKDVIKATKYVSPTLIVRGVRKTYKLVGRKPKDEGNLEVILTIGKPNYVEREFVALCKKAKEPFPVKKIQLKTWKKK